MIVSHIVQMDQLYYVLKHDGLNAEWDRAPPYASNSYGRSVPRPPTTVLVKAGSLWKQTRGDSIETSADGQPDGLYEPVAAVRNAPTNVVMRSCEHDDLLLRCTLQDLHRLNGEVEFQLLAAVIEPDERLRLLETENGSAQLRDGCRIVELWSEDCRRGSKKQMPEPGVVIVQGNLKKATGLVRYVGRLAAFSGLWFGTELTQQFRGLGTTNGTVKDRCYFTCADRCGIFLTINQILFTDINSTINDACRSHRRNPSCEMADPSRSSRVTTPDDLPETELLPRPPLSVDERVVWISDTGPEVGTVRWIGILPDSRIREYTIGVEFDNPIGTGTGKYNNKQLFRTRQNHASLIPVLGLMKAEEFFGSASLVPAQPYIAVDASLSTTSSFKSHSSSKNSSKTDAVSVQSTKLEEIEENLRYSLDSKMSTKAGRIDRSEQPGEDMVDTSLENDRRSVRLGRPVTKPLSASKPVEVHSLTEPTMSGTGGRRGGSFTPPSDISRQTESTTASERSIYDREPEHCYENVEKDADGRLLNRDTLAFRMVDSVAERQSQQYSGHLSSSGEDISGYHAAVTGGTRTTGRRAQQNADRATNSTVAMIHRSSRSVDNIFTEEAASGGGASADLSRRKSPERKVPMQSSADSELVQQLPYRTGRSTFYQRVDGQEEMKQPTNHQSNPVIETQSNATYAVINKANKRSVFVSPGASPTRSSDRASNSVSNSSVPVVLRNNEVTSSSGRNSVDPPRILKPTDTIGKNAFASPERYVARGDEADSVSCKVVNEMRSSVGIIPKPLSRAELMDTDLDLGSVVEFDIQGVRHYGVIQWIGFIADRKDPIAGIELEEESPDAVDGVLGHTRLFDCAPNKGYFEHLHNLCKDRRFTESSKFVHRMPSQLFGSIECVSIPGTVLPPSFDPSFIGQNRGIQGHHNSCYMDATLFGMFAFTMVFDTVLHRPRRANGDIERYDEVQAALRDGIVNPLRKNFYVRADKVLQLRRLLDKSSSVQGLMSEEKDPEEFLNSLLQQTLKADPFIHLSSGQDSYFYQLFMDKDDCVRMPTTQQLLELSFLQSDVKLSQIPSCLILQMPRFGKEYKMFHRIVPSLFLDITDILLYGVRECAICGVMATHECKNCFREFGDGLDKITFCDVCLAKSHSRNKRSSHRPIKLPANADYRNHMHAAGSSSTAGHQGADFAFESPREKMELFAVICIETSHYVAFVKSGASQKAPWVFFDSMADRKGEQHGYNIPSVEQCQYLPSWLADDTFTEIHRHREDRDLPEQMRRLLCDAYICMYQSCSLVEYR